MTWNDTAEAVFGHTLLVGSRLQRLTDATVGPELTGKQWLTLLILRSLPSPITSVQAVADVMGTSHQNVTKQIAALEKAGWVERARAADRRKWEIRITARTESWLAAHTELGALLLRQLFAGITAEELETTLTVLSRAMTTADALTGKLARVGGNSA